MAFNSNSARRSVIAAAAAIGIGALALASAAQSQVTFHRGNDSDPETLDAHKTQTVGEAHLLRDLLEGLVIHNAKGEVAPGVAESWEHRDDGKVVRFKLRANAKWSNGDAVTAADFVYSLRRIMDPATGAKYATILYPIKNAAKVNKAEGGLKPEDLGVKAIDDRTLEIALEQATPFFIELLTHQTGLPVHAASVQKHGKDFVKPENWVGNGAYRLTENVPNSQIKLVKNAQFHDAANVKIDQVIYYPRPDLAAAARQFMAGELHFTTDIPADQVKFLKEKVGDQLKIAPYLGIFYLAIDTRKAPFNDVRVRQALSLAIDREFIAEQIWGNTMIPAYSFVPPGIAAYERADGSRAPADVDFKALSPIDREARAKKLLAEAGFGPGNPLKVELRYNMTDNNKNTVVALADQWKGIGVETSQISSDGKTHFAFLREGGAFNAARAGWIADYADPQNFLFLLESNQPGLNYAKYSNPEFDGLMAKAAAEQDAKKRAAVLYQANAVISRDQPYIPMLYYSTKNLVSSKLEGFHTNPRGAFATRFYSLKP